MDYREIRDRMRERMTSFGENIRGASSHVLNARKIAIWGLVSLAAVSVITTSLPGTAKDHWAILHKLEAPVSKLLDASEKAVIQSDKMMQEEVERLARRVAPREKIRENPPERIPPDFGSLPQSEKHPSQIIRAFSHMANKALKFDALGVALNREFPPGKESEAIVRKAVERDISRLVTGSSLTPQQKEILKSHLPVLMRETGDIRYQKKIIDGKRTLVIDAEDRIAVAINIIDNAQNWAILSAAKEPTHVQIETERTLSRHSKKNAGPRM